MKFLKKLPKWFCLQLNRINVCFLVQILELLLGFWVVPQLRNMVCKFIFESQVAQDRAMTSKLIASRWMSAPLFAIIHWTCLSFDIHETVSTMALEFLVKMLEVGLQADTRIWILRKFQLPIIVNFSSCLFFVIFVKMYFSFSYFFYSSDYSSACYWIHWQWLAGPSQFLGLKFGTCFRSKLVGHWTI